MVHLNSGAATDVGRVREANEDAYLSLSPVFVVADGMGGHHGGEIASAIAVEEFARLAHEGYDASRGTDLILEVLGNAQRRIREYGEEQDDADDWYAGTTVVAALLHEDQDGPQWLLVNLGDSRIYRLDDGVLDQVTVDHSLVQELLDAGQIDASEAAVHPDRHVITRALGGPALRPPDFFLLPLATAQRVILCSDGVSGMLGEAEMQEILMAASDPRDAAEAIVQAAVEAGGQDNATAVVVDVVGLSESDEQQALRTAPISLVDKLGALP